MIYDFEDGFQLVTKEIMAEKRLDKLVKIHGICINVQKKGTI